MTVIQLRNRVSIRGRGLIVRKRIYDRPSPTQGYLLTSGAE